MAANVVSGSSGGRDRGRRGRRAVMSEINVTPFVDVMLVLLIVFMVSAPLLTRWRRRSICRKARPSRSTRIASPLRPSR